MTIRRAAQQDIPAVAAIYEAIHTREEQGQTTVGWARGIYPTQATAQAALDRGDLFVQEENGVITGAAIINQQQVDCYAGGRWRFPAEDQQVMVLHTLVISPAAARRGLGKAFVRFYEEYALQNGCPYLRMDTNARNLGARALYHKLGYEEADVVPCVFNGIEGVQLVLLEKYLGGGERA